MEFAVPLISGGFTAAKTALVLGMGPTPKNEAIANIKAKSRVTPRMRANVYSVYINFSFLSNSLKSNINLLAFKRIWYHSFIPVPSNAPVITIFFNRIHRVGVRDFYRFPIDCICV